MAQLDTFDVVYSWGVRHTEAMWEAIADLNENVAIGGKLYVVRYNDRGGASKRWLTIKRLYNRLPTLIRIVLFLAVHLPLELGSFLICLVQLAPLAYFEKSIITQKWYELVP